MIDDKFLEELGLGGIVQDEKDRMKAHIEQTLQDRIGEKVEQRLDEAKLDEFDKIITGGDSQAINTWLTANIPTYNQIVDEELAALKEEIKPQVPGIIQQFSVA